MRLKATVENVITFSRIVQSVEKQSKLCNMRFSEKTLQIICTGDNDSGVQVWSQIKVETLFANVICQSNANNEITCEVQTEPLSQALRSATSAAEVTMKLAKRDDVAVLSFDMQILSRQGKKMDVTHDVRVKVLRPSEVAALREPLCPAPDIHLILPPLAKIRTVVERMAKLSHVVGFSANKEGIFKLEIATDSVTVETQWKDCPLPQINEPGAEAEPAPEDENPAKFYGVLLEVRSLLRFLSTYVVSTTTIACICSGHCLIVYVYIGEMEESGGVLTFYMPSRVEDNED